MESAARGELTEATQERRNHIISSFRTSAIKLVTGRDAEWRRDEGGAKSMQGRERTKTLSLVRCILTGETIQLRNKNRLDGGKRKRKEGNKWKNKYKQLHFWLVGEGKSERMKCRS